MYKTGSEFKDKMWLLRVDGQDVVIEHRGLMRGGIHKSCSTSLYGSLDLQLPMQLVPITIKVSSNPSHGEVYSIQQFML
jgi:hypothetical protein